jgi:cell division protein FtsZ
VTVIATGFDAPENVAAQPQMPSAAAQPVQPNNAGLNFGMPNQAAPVEPQQTVTPAADFIDIPVWMQKK